MGPVAFLAAFPLARRFGWFWAEIPGHVRERALGSSEWIWESGRGDARDNTDAVQNGLPIRIFIFAPFAAGLQLYWITNNLLTIAQQYWLYRRFGLHLSDTHPVHT